MVLDDNAEIAITGAVVLVLLTGKVPEDNAGVFDDDVVSSFTTSGSVVIDRSTILNAI